MDYERIYTQLINRARTRTLVGYKEKHHIIPRCIGGNNDASNLVDLTAREHFIAHKLLCEIYPNTDKLQYALWRMMNPQSKNHIRKYSISSHEYEIMRKIISEKMHFKMKGIPKTKEHRVKNSQSKIGKLKSAETKRKMSEAKKGKIFSTEHKNNLSIANTGNNHNDQTKRKIGDASKLRKHSAITKQKISDSRKGIIFSDDHRKKLSDAKKGKTGRKHSAETKLKIKLSKLGFNR